MTVPICAPVDSRFEGINAKSIQKMRFWNVHKDGVYRRSRYICACRHILWKLINPISREGPKRKFYIHWKISFSPKVPIPLCGPQYHLTVSRTQVSTHRGRVFLKLSADKLLLFKWSQAQVYFFFEFIWKYVVFMSLWPRTIKILISNWPRTRKFSQFFKNTGGEDLFLPWTRVGHALRPIFMLWLVKIWQVSSCGKFMQHLESCLLWQLKLTEFCVNLWCF